jgi:hypothetical protein
MARPNNHLAPLIILLGALQACNSSQDRAALPSSGVAVTAPIGTATPPPFGAPRTSAVAAAPRTPVIQDTRVSERTSVSPDGRSVRTERTTTSVSFDPDRAAGALERLASSGTATAANQGIPGVWQMQSSSTRLICTVNLYGGPQETQGQANSVGCPVGGTMQGITGWRYESGKLTILKGSEVSIVMDQLGPNRFDGTATWGFLTTKIALYR